MTCSRLAALIGCLGLASLVLPGASQAASVTTVDFVATATAGPLAGKSYNGWFSYDNTSLTPTAFSFNFFITYSLSDTTYLPITLRNGTPNSLAFLVDNGNNVSTGMPDFYISLNQGLPDFLYGYDSAGFNFPNPDGSCPDTVNACYSWEGTGNVKFVGVTTVPEPAGPLPLLGYMVVVGGLAWMKRHRMAR